MHLVVRNRTVTFVFPIDTAEGMRHAHSTHPAVPFSIGHDVDAFSLQPSATSGLDGREILWVIQITGQGTFYGLAGAQKINYGQGGYTAIAASSEPACTASLVDLFLSLSLQPQRQIHKVVPEKYTPPQPAALVVAGFPDSDNWQLYTFRVVGELYHPENWYLEIVTFDLVRQPRQLPVSR